MKPPFLMDEGRFWVKVNKEGPLADARPDLTPCWIWTASVQPSGYSQFRVGNRMLLGHRVAYELLVGPIPPGLELDHLCRRPLCVNPTHLEPVTGAENTRRAADAKTHCINGHDYSDQNVRFDADGHRRCQPCRSQQQRVRNEQRSAAQRRRRALARQGGDR